MMDTAAARERAECPTCGAPGWIVTGDPETDEGYGPSDYFVRDQPDTNRALTRAEKLRQLAPDQRSEGDDAILALADEVDRLQAIEKAAKRLSVMHGSSFGLPTLSQSNLDAAVEAWADLRTALASSTSCPVTP